MAVVVALLVLVLVLINVTDVGVAHASMALGRPVQWSCWRFGRWAGLTWQELGVGRGTWRRGLAWALAAIGAVAVVFAAGAALPATRGAFREARCHLAVVVLQPAARPVAYGPVPAATPASSAGEAHRRDASGY